MKPVITAHNKKLLPENINTIQEILIQMRGFN